jgi:cytochrome c-type biogenesis protein CcmH/NrfF
VTRREALALLLAGIALVVAGMTWWIGPIGLIVGGMAVVVVALTANVREATNADAAGHAARQSPERRRETV